MDQDVEMNGTPTSSAPNGSSSQTKSEKKGIIIIGEEKLKGELAWLESMMLGRSEGRGGSWNEMGGSVAHWSLGFFLI